MQGSVRKEKDHLRTLEWNEENDVYMLLSSQIERNREWNLESLYMLLTSETARKMFLTD